MVPYLLIFSLVATTLCAVVFWIGRGFVRRVFPLGAPYVWPALFETRGAPFRDVVGREAARNVVTALATERILLLSRSGGQFSVLGESGTVYAVSISTTPTCDCPSFAHRFSRGAKTACCKHVAYVLVKVLGVPPNSYILHQTALLSWEVRYWLGRTQQGALAPLGVREALGAAHGVERGDDASPCAICYDDIDTAQRTNGDTARCAAACKSLYHSTCVRDYNESQRPAPPICAVCRSPWVSQLVVAQVVDRVGVVRQQITHPHGEWKGRRRAGSGARRGKA
jgi:hypothetical protein